MQYVRVTNNSDRHINGRFDGEDFPFPIGESRDVPGYIANHVFGWGSPARSEDKLRAYMNLGLVKTSDDLPRAEEFMRGFTFQDVEMVGRPIDDELEGTPSGDLVPRRLAAGAQRIGDVRPNADADAAEGEDSSSPEARDDVV